MTSAISESVWCFRSFTADAVPGVGFGILGLGAHCRLQGYLAHKKPATLADYRGTSLKRNRFPCTVGNTVRSALMTSAISECVWCFRSFTAEAVPGFGVWGLGFWGVGV